jgi:hypothetical protein
MNVFPNKKWRIILPLLCLCLLGFQQLIDKTFPAKHENESKKHMLTSGTKQNNIILNAHLTENTGQKKNLQEWEILFDGKSTHKWKSIHSDSFPSASWTIEKGCLVLNKKGGGDIITKEKYSDFDLSFEFKLTRFANSGIKYFVGEMESTKDKTKITNGPEYQIIDDFNHPAVKNHDHEEASTASLYLIYAPQNKKLFPDGKWNNGRIVSKGKSVEHWLNGFKVVSYEWGSEDFFRRVARTKFKEYTNYGLLHSGHILITDHDDKVYFRNIKIKRL